MKKSELESILRSARPPEISGPSLEAFPRRIIAGLQRDRAPAPPSRTFLPRLAWAGGLVACLLAAFVLVREHERTETATPASSDVLASAKLVREMLAMFPNRVRAIVEDARGMSLVLSDSDNVPASTLLYVRICDGIHCSSFVTFSGQEIQVAGQKVTALSDAQGGIIVTGSQFVWSSTEPIETGHQIKIEAKTLGPAAM